MKEFYTDKLFVRVFETRTQAGTGLARDFAESIRGALKEKQTLNVVFAAAPSQNEALEALCADESIPWDKINAYHMDEYAGLTREDKSSFGRYLDEHIFGKVNFRSVHYIGTGLDEKAECKRYAGLLKNAPPDFVLMGVGENGHIAFNDPWVAKFDDKEVIKKVPLDEVCRMQQVHDGCFKTLDDVPGYALTLTIPTLLSARGIFCIVPGKSKANAVARMINEEISERCPASALRDHPCARLYLEKESASRLDL